MLRNFNFLIKFEEKNLIYKIFSILKINYNLLVFIYYIIHQKNFIM
jgi:hypothetical protein